LRRLTCPSCGEDISARFAPGRDSYCPACGIGLAVRLGPYNPIPIFAVIIPALSFYAFGLRGKQLYACVFLAFLPTMVAMGRITAALVSVELTATGNFRGILHPVEQRIAVENETPGAEEPAPPILTTIDPPRTLEGLALRAGFSALVLFALWLAVRPIVYRIYPELTVAMHGPQGFPITAHVLPGAIQFSNGSDAPWHCDTELWHGGPVASFDLDARGTRRLTLDEFSSPDGSTIYWPEEPVTTSMQMTCAEPSGLVHSGTVD
jgi:hypothetical protein